METSTRPDWTEYFLEIAEVVAKRGTCPRLQVGAVIVDQNHGIISTGYNGSPRGIDECTKIGCLEINGRCERTIHAEVNAILQAGRSGSSVVECVLYCTHRPCYRCIVLLIQAGIRTIIYENSYASDNEQLVQEICREANVNLRDRIPLRVAEFLARQISDGSKRSIKK